MRTPHYACISFFLHVIVEGRSFIVNLDIDPLTIKVFRHINRPWPEHRFSNVARVNLSDDPSPSTINSRLDANFETRRTHPSQHSTFSPKSADVSSFFLHVHRVKILKINKAWFIPIGSV